MGMEGIFVASMFYVGDPDPTSSILPPPEDPNGQLSSC